jgi:phage gpG-like protein
MAEIKGGNLFQQNMAALSKKVKSASSARIGFIDGATYPDGTSVAEVAAINNFGAPGAGIPARPFFSDLVKQNSAEWAGKLVKLFQKTGDIKTSLDLLAVEIEGELRESIIKMNFPANSPVTNLLKQRFPTRDGMTFEDVLQAWSDVKDGVTAPAGKPLVWSGLMLASISSEVT